MKITAPPVAVDQRRREKSIKETAVKLLRLVFVLALGAGLWSYVGQAAWAQGANPAGAIFRRHTTASPGVTPYLNLLNNNVSGTATPYQSLVRPQIEQQRLNQQQQRSIQGLQQNLQAQARANVGGAGIERGTGHQSVFMNYLHYYPALGRR
ncbi:MAG: hypothetical protein R3C10_08400 [Pirellulales bacterium]